MVTKMNAIIDKVKTHLPEDTNLDEILDFIDKAVDGRIHFQSQDEEPLNKIPCECVMCGKPAEKNKFYCSEACRQIAVGITEGLCPECKGHCVDSNGFTCEECKGTGIIDKE